MADDDSAVCVPVALAAKVIEQAPFQTYYPVHADAWTEYEAWRKARDATTGNAGPGQGGRHGTRPDPRTFLYDHCRIGDGPRVVGR